MSKYVVERCLGEDCGPNPFKDMTTTDLRQAIKDAFDSADQTPTFNTRGGPHTTHRHTDPVREDGVALELSFPNEDIGLGVPRVIVRQLEA